MRIVYGLAACAALISLAAGAYLIHPGLMWMVIGLILVYIVADSGE